MLFSFDQNDFMHLIREITPIKSSAEIFITDSIRTFMVMGFKLSIVQTYGIFTIKNQIT